MTPTVTAKEADVLSSDKPWVQAAIDVGRQVPRWIADLPDAKQFDRMMSLRERAFPATKRVTP